VEALCSLDFDEENEEQADCADNTSNPYLNK